MIGELGICVISEATSIDMGYTCGPSRRSDHREVKLAQMGRVAQHGRPDVS